jgi:DNA-binding transcriptional MerR regulator
MADSQLTIGELAARTGLATSALRYYEDLGLVVPAARVSGQRRFDKTAVDTVGVILLLRDVGFSLTEIAELFTSSPDRDEWRATARAKIDELGRRIHTMEVARVALEHLLQCRHEELFECPNFLRTIGDRLEGKLLEESHTH